LSEKTFKASEDRGGEKKTVSAKLERNRRDWKKAPYAPVSVLKGKRSAAMKKEGWGGNRQETGKKFGLPEGGGGPQCAKELRCLPEKVQKAFREASRGMRTLWYRG